MFYFQIFTTFGYKSLKNSETETVPDIQPGQTPESYSLPSKFSEQEKTQPQGL